MRLMVILICWLSVRGLALAAEPSRPNIILIISDDQGFPDYGFMGNPVVKTPQLDRLAAGALLYTRGYTMPVCSPSLACLLTGRMPHQHGITGNDLAKGTPEATSAGKSRHPLAARLLENPVMLPRALSDAGYLTFQTGKLWNMTYQEAGFTHGMTATAGRHGDAGLTIGRQGLQPIYDFIAGARTANKPFFVWYAPMMPHDPHNPPDALLAKYTGKGLPPRAEKYYAMVEWFDQTCGELDGYLTKHGLADNTVLLYLSDNGWDAMRGMGGKHSKLSPYELGIRTPMFVRWSAKIKPRRDDQTLASILDFSPTIMKLAKVPVPTVLPGLDLLDRRAMTARESVFVESYTHDIADLAEPAKSLVAQVVVNGWFKLLIPGQCQADRQFAVGPQTIELFDLKADPLEMHNLAAEQPEVVKRLQTLQQTTWKVD